jgi:hypothetical protein
MVIFLFKSFQGCFVCSVDPEELAAGLVAVRAVKDLDGAVAGLPLSGSDSAVGSNRALRDRLVGGVDLVGSGRADACSANR